MGIVGTAAVLLAVAMAADISGKWAGDMPGRGGDTTPTTFIFKVDGEKLTGSMTGPQGDIPLQEGKVAGNQISFSTTLDFGGNSIKIVYKGAVNVSSQFFGEIMRVPRRSRVGDLSPVGE